MALFGSKRKEVNKEKRSASRVAHARAAKLAPGTAHEIIKAPWFSEKALLGTDKGVYVFAVPREATKVLIAGAIKEIYKIAPRKIRIVNLPGARVSARRAGSAIRARRRKAYVYLNAGDTIQLA
ncbi:50S ribosomal protein L23 [Candidatus Kaiserbacteria bacterium]|nr:50S ribosomal protein L23 [Candidatus Kaiserbacteria bacterium]